MLHIKINIGTQRLCVYDEQSLVRDYPISTAKNGAGEQYGSEQTPRGQHIIRAKIGKNCPVNTVFKGRRPTGEIFTPELKRQAPERDWILTRIMWLSGQEVGKNRLGKVDTMRRFVYIHGAPEEAVMGTPGSRGCIRMRNEELLDLFELIPARTPVFISE